MHPRDTLITSGRRSPCTMLCYAIFESKETRGRRRGGSCAADAAVVSSALHTQGEETDSRDGTCHEVEHQFMGGIDDSFMRRRQMHEIGVAGGGGAVSFF